MTKIVLIRHGQTEWNITGRFQGQSDVKLTETGMKQASELAERFPFNKIDAVYAVRPLLSHLVVHVHCEEVSS